MFKTNYFPLKTRVSLSIVDTVQFYTTPSCRTVRQLTDIVRQDVAQLHLMVIVKPVTQLHMSGAG